MFSLHESVLDNYPGLKMGFLMMHGVSPSYAYENYQAAEADVIAGIKQRYGQLDRKELKSLYPIHVYVSYYKKFGYNYPVLAQLESILQGKKSLHTESHLLRTMFLSELNSVLLTAGHDLKQIQLPLELKAAIGTETYLSISGKEVAAIRGDVLLCDGNGTISSILRGPDYKSRITESTTDVLFSIYAPAGIDADSINIQLNQLEELIKAYSPTSKVEMKRVFSAE